MSEPTSERNPIDVLADGFLDRHRRGESPQISEYIQRYPQLADEIRELFPVLLEMEQARVANESNPRADNPIPDYTTGTVIGGRYKLLERIGEGGMGSVWMAQQSAPVRRLVAVKLIKAGMDSKAVLARFEAERQALAVMDHPNIAKILDGGVAEKGSPYFVMELVKSVPITKYCDEHKLTPRQRLELFVQVCHAIQHAHQKGIIHRDIKPSNVIVALYDDKPVPKVIDFGVAKATGQTLTEQTLNTGFGGIIGTPEYMSPEQASLNNLDIDTRSDIYSLGVLLYELLVGSPPFQRKQLEQAGLLEILRVIREDDPPRPSTKLSTADALPSLSANRGTEPKTLTGILRNELDWIVMKALEKDRARRYETANGFAADINRYLAGEPVHAHPPSAAYRFKKLLRRNKSLVTATCTVAVALALFAWGWYESVIRIKAHALRDRLLEASAADVPSIVADMTSYRRWLDPLLREAFDKTSENSRQKLHASLALLPFDSHQVEYLYSRFLEAAPNEVSVIRDALTPYKDQLLSRLWAVAQMPEKGKESQRLRAAAALAMYDPESTNWTLAQAAIVNDLCAVPLVYSPLWMDVLRPARNKLLPQLSSIFQDPGRRETERSLATSILADYAAGNPRALAELLMNADVEQFAVMYPKFKDQAGEGLSLLSDELDKQLPADLPAADMQREKLAKRQANAAVALVRLNQPTSVWPLLKHSPDPRLRSYIIHRLSPLGANSDSVVGQLGRESDITIRRALLLCLGEFDEQQLRPAEREGPREPRKQPIACPHRTLAGGM